AAAEDLTWNNEFHRLFGTPFGVTVPLLQFSRPDCPAEPPGSPVFVPDAAPGAVPGAAGMRGRPPWAGADPAVAVIRNTERLLNAESETTLLLRPAGAAGRLFLGSPARYGLSRRAWRKRQA